MSSTPRTEIQVSKNSEFTNIIYDEVSHEDAPYRTSHKFDESDLPWACNLWIRVRHFHVDTQAYTEWSPVVKFMINTPPSIIGVCLDSTSGTFSWIDGAGNQVINFDYMSHPIYQNASMVSSGDSPGAMTLTKIPKVYVNTAISGIPGTYSEGKKCWWISDIRVTGFNTHPAFKRDVEESDYTYLGTYLCSLLEQEDGSTLAVSRKNMEVATSITRLEAMQYVEDKGNAYRLFDIWDLSLVKLLAIIAKGSGNTQSSWGRNTSTEANPRTGTTNCHILFKGTSEDPLVILDDLWQHHWYYVDRLQIIDGQYVIKSPIDLMQNIDIDQSLSTQISSPPETSGWVTDVAECPITIGNDIHNLQELMIPALVSSERTDSAFDDYHSSTINSPIFIAGCSKEYNIVESIGYWQVYATSCPRRENATTEDGSSYVRCIQSERACDEVSCRYAIDTAVNAQWEDKAGLFSSCTNSLPSVFLGMRIAKQ